MKIGITERGDAGLDFSWMYKMNEVDGVILITKNINTKFINAVLSISVIKPIIVHCTCTGLGSTAFEPNVPPADLQISRLEELIDRGFPAENVVLRVDPIIPNSHGIFYADHVLRICSQNLPWIKRVRISVLDEYKHVKSRFREAGIDPVYGEDFNPSLDKLIEVGELLKRFPYKYEACAEAYLTKVCNQVEAVGCISKRDLDIMGLSCDEEMSENPQGRSGCHCLSCKYELLENKHRCAHQCLYCYWH